MAQQTIATMEDAANSRQELRLETNAELVKIEANFGELYTLSATKLKPEVAAGTTQELPLASLNRTTLTNNLQVASVNVALTVAAPIVAGMEWDMAIAVTLNTGVYWRLTLPLGASFLFEGTMGTNGGSATFTAPARGTTARCKAITIATGVVVIIESAATTITVA